MKCQTVRVNLRYERADLKALLRYVRANDVARNGRYDARRLPQLNIWSHTWSNPGCKVESTAMFSLDFDWNTASLMSVTLHPGFDWEAFLDELATLERTALGDVVYGKRRCEPKT